MIRNFYSILLIVCCLYIQGCGGNDSADPSGNRAPNAPNSPNPANNASDVSTGAQLTWQCTDPDGDPLEYDIYCGSQSSPPLVLEHTSQASYQPSGLSANTTYYWMVSARDTTGASTSGPVWRFTTQQQATGFRLIGRYDPAGDVQRVFVLGDYAYIPGMIVSVADPAHPTYVGQLPIGNTPYYVSQQYSQKILYCIANDIAAYDVTAPLNVHLRDQVVLSGTPHDLLVNFITVRVSCSEVVAEIDVSDPSNMELIRNNDIYHTLRIMAQAGDYLVGVEYNQFFVYSQYSQVGTFQPNYQILEMQASGSHVYAACSTNGLQIIDISNPASPHNEGGYLPAGPTLGLALSGHYAFLANGTAGVDAIDIANPAAPSLIATYPIAGNTVDIFSSGDYLYVAAYSAGLYILQLTP